MTLKLPLWLWIVLTVLVTVACGLRQDVFIHSSPPYASPSECRTIVHQSGKTQICGKPQRIVVMGPNLLELLLVLGEQPIGFGDHIRFHGGDYDNPTQQIPYLGDRMTTKPINVGLTYAPSLEALLKSKPDLILGLDYLSSQYPLLSKIAPTLLFKWFDSEANLRAIATAVGKPQQAESLLGKMQQDVAKARQQLAPIATAYPKVFMLSSSNLRDISLINPHSMCSAVVADLGFQLVYPPRVDPSKILGTMPLSLEELPQLDKADLGILLGFDFAVLGQSAEGKRLEAHQLEPLKRAWATNAIAQALSESKAGRVIFLPAYLCLGLPGPIGTELYLKALQQQLQTFPLP
ncbi:MAG: iron-siderophore ABC transporter substrate-binding protein [Acaryochloris sp. SU_5_25]|nr:iron-siderophore ABC transporter substrate-binding protein [Acaryochloris sp. SU_5_25]